MELAATMAADLESWGATHPLRWCYLPCTVEVFSLAQAFLYTCLGLIASVLISKGYITNVFAQASDSSIECP